MTVLPDYPLTKKALHEARQVALEQCRELGRRLRYEARPRPAPDDPVLDTQGNAAFYEAVIAGWNQMDLQVRSNDFAREGRQLYLDGRPLPSFPNGAPDFETAVADLRTISARRAGWMKAQQADASAKRRQHIIERAAAPDTDNIRGHLRPTPERAAKGRLGREIVEGDAKEEVRVYRERRPTELHRLAVRYPDDIPPELVRAGLTLQAEWQAAGLTNRTVGAYSPLSGAGQGEMSDRRAAAFEALQMLLAKCWQLRHIKELTIKVVVEEQPTNQIGYIKVGLTQLARYYDQRDRRADVGVVEAADG